MEAELQRTLISRGFTRADGWREVVFSVDEARRALRYVSAVVRDAAAAYREAQECKQALEVELEPRVRIQLSDQRDAALRRLNAAIDECNAVGVDLKDIFEGVVQFTACIDDRTVRLVWRLGDSIEHAWTEGQIAV